MVADADHEDDVDVTLPSVTTSLQIVDTLDFLLGTWNVERSIEDHRSGSRGFFSGRAALVEVEADHRSAPGGRSRVDRARVDRARVDRARDDRARDDPARVDRARVDRARYDEEGELRFGAHVGPATRRLGFTRVGDGAVTLHFADGRPFVDLDLRSGAWSGVHSCGDDRYEITTVVRSHAVVQEHWRVRGPVKAYDAATTLVRVSARNASPTGASPAGPPPAGAPTTA